MLPFLGFKKISYLDNCKENLDLQVELNERLLDSQIDRHVEYGLEG